MDGATVSAVTLAELAEKLDLLTAQVQYLTEQAEAAARERSERAELLHDATPILNDIMRLSSEQLEEIQEYVDLGDLLRLAKRLLRNGRNLERMLDQLESLMDLAQTLGPLGDDVFKKAAHTLEAAEERGYFRFARGGARVVDNVVTSLTEADLKQIGDDVMLILIALKDMTQPEIMALLRAVISESKREVAEPVETSFRSLVSHMRDPDVRRGLTLSMRVLGVIGRQAAD